MTVKDLEKLLRRARVPEHFYVTNGGLGAGECVGIEAAPPGWSVYYSEHGRKSSLAVCPDEDGACRALITHVNRMLREVGLPAISP